MPQKSSRALRYAAFIFLLALMEALMLFSVHRESQTSDEAYSLYAGYMHLTQGNFYLCPAYPPLVKEVAAAPLLAYRPVIPVMTPDEQTDFRSGRKFLYSNRADAMLFAARTAMTVFPLLLAALVFFAAWEMFGLGPAWIALALTVFEPTLLAHGPLVTNDVALACFLFATVYSFWRYVKKPCLMRLLICGVAAGVTLASKHSGLIVFGILGLLVPLTWITEPAPASDATLGESVDHSTAQNNIVTRSGRLILALIGVAIVSVVVLWGFYRFRYSPLAGDPAPSLDPILAALSSRTISATIALAAKIHLLPAAYLDGLAFFFSTASRPTYLLGTRYVHGVWFYFPTALAIKSTIGFLLLLALAAFAPALRARQQCRQVLWMLVPAVIYFGASVTSDLDIGIRHLLPAFPFLIVLAAVAAWSIATKSRKRKYAIALLVLLHAGSSLRSFPNFLPYCNELWGGSSKTYRLLSDSNVDWGQGLLAVKAYVARHPSEPCWLAYFGSVDPAYYGIPCKLLPVETSVVWERTLDEIPPDIQGTVLISATELSGQPWGPDDINPYAPFRKADPVENIAGSVLVYRGTFHVPLVSALSILGTVVELARHGDYAGAMARLDEAQALAPESVDVNFVRGGLLKSLGRKDEARQAFQNALHFALTIHPEVQAYWVTPVEKELKGLE